MPSNLPEPVRKSLGIELRIASIIAALLIASGWGLLAANRLFGFKRDPKPDQDFSGPFFLGVAIVFTLGAVVFYFLKTKKTRNLLSRGTLTKGQFQGATAANSMGMHPATFTYLVQAKEYQTKQDIPHLEVERLQLHPEVDLIYDPNHPETSHVITTPTA